MAFALLVAACGSEPLQPDPSDMSCFMSHRCSPSSCCDPVCATAFPGSACSEVGYSCSLFESSCSCNSDQTWHCRYPGLEDMVRPDHD